MVKADGICQWLMQDQLKQDQFQFMYETCKVLYDSPVRDKFLANDVTTLDSVLPKLLAYRSVMVIRNIQIKQAAEKKKLREKMEREGKGFTLEGNSDPRYMTQLDLEWAKLDKRQEEDASWQRSEEQLKELKAEEERKLYGRFWIWEGYYNEANNG